MSLRNSTFSALGALTLIAVTMACDRAETTNSPVTTTSPAGESTAPSSAAAGQRDEALVRVVHAIPDGSPMDVYAGDLTVFDNLAYKTVTPYRALDGQRYSFSLKPAGTAGGAALATNTEGLDDGEYYTVFALPGDGRTAHLRVVDDLLTEPATGKAKVRIVHASADAGEIDIVAAGAVNTLFDGVDFQAVTGYENVDPLNGEIEVRAQGQPTPLVRLMNARIEAGRFYTIVVVGNARTTPPLEAFLIEDAPTPTTTTTR